jgi:hypothetical protein
MEEQGEEQISNSRHCPGLDLQSIRGQSVGEQTGEHYSTVAKGCRPEFRPRIPRIVPTGSLRIGDALLFGACLTKYISSYIAHASHMGLAVHSTRTRESSWEWLLSSLRFSGTTHVSRPELTSAFLPGNVCTLCQEFGDTGVSGGEPLHGRDKSLTYHRKTGLTGSYLKRIAAGELAEADNYCTGQRNLECPPHFVSGGFREAIRCRLVRSLTDLRCLRRPDHISDRKRAARPSSIP